MDWRAVHRRTIIAFLVLAILLVGSAAVVYRNIDRLSRLEFANQRRLLASALLGFRREFAGVLLDLTRAYELPIRIRTAEVLQSHLAERYQLLQEEGSDLVPISQLSLLVYSGDQPKVFLRLQPEEGVFIEEAAPVSVLELGPPLPPRPVPRPGGRGARLVLLDGKFVLAVPQGGDRTAIRRRPGPLPGLPPSISSGPRPNPGRSESEGAESRLAESYLALLQLDQDYLGEEVFERLNESYFRRPLINGFEVAITTDRGNKVVYQSDKQLNTSFFSSADASVPLTVPTPGPGRRGLAVEPERGANPAFRQAGALNLVARHHSGSLEAAVENRRIRDLLEAFGILFLLAAAMVTLVLSLQRTRTLARRQMDFVAGISHELRNPLTAIQSAGYALAKGAVKEEEKIRRYGQIISREGQRLTRMVEQVLSYAGIEQSVKQYDWQIVRMEEVLEMVLQEYVSVFEEEAWEVKVKSDRNLPPLSADPKALKSCLRNLIDNSLKYADEVKILQIEVNSRLDSGRSWIDVSVQDRGRGLSSSEIQRIFEPFYRGADHLASSKPGTGLGLALVERHVKAHGGKVQVFSEPGGGANFLLSFPAATNSEEVREDENGA
jgi:signal transduction histidine kinase